MKYIRLFLVILACLWPFALAYGAKFYPATVLTGGGTGALDKIDGNSLSDKDTAVVLLENDGTYGNAAFFYVLDAASGATESVPAVISPDSNAGTKRWLLTGVKSSGLWLTNGSTVRPVATTSGHTFDLESYDNDGTAWVSMLSCANGNSPTCTALGDWDLSGANVTLPAGYLCLRGTTTNTKSGNYTAGTDNECEVYGGTIYVTGAATITLPAIAARMMVTVITIGGIAVSVDTNANDLMVLDGTALNDGDKATNTSTTGDAIICTYYSADGWYCASSSPDGDHWTDGGP